MYDNPSNITQSKITAFGCAARYHKLHILHMPDTSDPARRGSTVHRANELYLKALAEQKMASDFDLAQWAFRQALVDEATPAHLVPDCEMLWMNHVETFELDLEAFLEAEERRASGRFSFKSDWTYIHADHVAAHDIKTHYQALTEEGAKRDLQARMTAYLTAQVFPGFSYYRFVWHFVRLRQIVSVDFKPADLDAIGRQLEAHADAIEEATRTDNWPATPGVTCAYCSFECPLVDDALRAPVRIHTVEEAELMASYLVLMKAKVAETQRVIEQYTALNGPVRSAEHEFAHRPYERLSFPAEATLAVLNAHGADTRKLTFGTTALRSWLTARKHASVKQDLDGVAEKKAGTKFSMKKLAVAGDDIDEGTGKREGDDAAE